MGVVNDSLLDIRNQLFSDTLASGLDLTTEVTYVSFAPGGYANGSFASATETQTTIKAIRSRFTQAEINDGAQSSTSDYTIKATDIKLVIKPVSGLSFEDYDDDYILIGSSKYQIINVSKSIIADDEFIYRVQIRKA